MYHTVHTVHTLLCEILLRFKLLNKDTLLQNEHRVYVLFGPPPFHEIHDPLILSKKNMYLKVNSIHSKCQFFFLIL
jgi:hypothetical protein